MTATRPLIAVLFGFIASACAPEPAQVTETNPLNTTATVAESDSRGSLVTENPSMIVHKSASCGCCNEWVKHMKKHGFAVAVNDVDNMDSVKERVGIPVGMGSCHTGEVAGYFIEGHVPAEDVQRLLKEKPDAKGLTVPRMPIGSPGMESGDQREPYDVFLVHKDGTTSVYAHHGE